jgi:uncharacterized protein (TIGR02118 family)
VFAALGTLGSAAVDVARATGGTAHVAVDGQRDPTFTSLVVADDRDALSGADDVGLYVVTVRRMRHQRRSWPVGAPTPGVTAAYVLVHHPDLDHAAADAHWRDVHAPLALRHHPGMWHYHQISVDEVLAGPAFDGVALCAFPSEQEMAERFFGDDEDRAVIAADVARFSDLAASPRRVRMVEWRFGPD